MLAVLSQMLDEIIVSSQLHVYHLSFLVCRTEIDIKGETFKAKIKETSLVYVWDEDEKTKHVIPRRNK